MLTDFFGTNGVDIWMTMDFRGPHKDDSFDFLTIEVRIRGLPNCSDRVRLGWWVECDAWRIYHEVDCCAA